MNLSNAFDSHLHLAPKDDIPGLLAAARAAGVTRFLAIGTDHEDSCFIQSLTSAHANLFCAIGVHPHEAAGFDGDLAPFRELAHTPGVVAIGEIGLDYHYTYSPRDTQRRVFQQFLELARELKLPAIIHCREAEADSLAVLRDAAAAGVRLEVHSFAGTPAFAEQCLALGAWFGFNGILTFPKADLVRAALAVVPLNRVLAETDSPYLAPAPHRGKRNEPAYLVEVIRAIAAIKEIPESEAAGVTSANACRFLGIPLDNEGAAAR